MTNEELNYLKACLKSGEYDGTHIMQAWIAIEELIKAREEGVKLKTALSTTIEELESWWRDQGTYGTAGYDKWIPELKALL